MRPAWILVVCATLASAALASPDEQLRVEFPLGAYVRPGRPLDVRIVGGADRVRAPGTPWALPQGERGDEFLLQLTGATTTLLSLEVDRGGRVERVSQAVESLPVDGTIVGVRSADPPPAGVRTRLLPSSGLPTVREGWLVFDAVDDGVAPAQIREFLASVAAARPAERPFVAPQFAAPDSQAFAATAELAASAPRLPSAVTALLVVLAGTEALLALVLRSRELSPLRRTAWLALPPIAALAFLMSGSRLPGALSATAVAVDAGGRRCVFVRVDARRDASASFALPGSATAAMVRYAPDDETVTSASAGRDVELELRAGEARIFAYSIELPVAEGPNPAPPRSLVSWLADRGIASVPASSPFDSSQVPRSGATVVIPAWSAASAGVPPMK